MMRSATIDRLFAGPRIEDILAALEQEANSGSVDAEWARKTAATIRTKSPTSLRIALEQMRRGKNWSFEECMKAEFRIVSRILYEPDFYEGVRAAIVDKDNRPNWKPATLAQVGVEVVEKYFAPLEVELTE
jgi:enoyl-CoA hydratase